MRRLYIVATLALTLISCDALQKQNIKGTYKYIGGNKTMRMTDHLEFTESKFMMPSIAGELATDYKVENGFVYAGPEGGQIRFKIVGADTLRNEDTFGFDGVYVRVQ